jgi:hypothetical protein
LGVVAGAVAIVRWYAYSTFYLGDDAGSVAIYQGEPQGVLWFHPLLRVTTQYPATQLRPVDERALAATISEPTLKAALTYAAFLHGEWQAGSTTTTTTTTSGAVTTTTAKKG